MKYLSFIFILFFSLGYCQKLKAVHFDDISKYEFEELDRLMVEQHGFLRMDDIEHEHQRVYTNNSDQLDQLIVITVIKDPKSCSHVLSIVDRSESSVMRLKEELPNAGYHYQGEKKMSEEILVSHFTKGRKAVLITDTKLLREHIKYC